MILDYRVYVTLGVLWLLTIIIVENVLWESTRKILHSEDRLKAMVEWGKVSVLFRFGLVFIVALGMIDWLWS